MLIKSVIKAIVAVSVVLAMVIGPTVSLTRESDVHVFFAGGGAAEKPLRLHVLAASDSPYDQSVKLAVRDSVLDYLEGVVAACSTKEEAMAAIEMHLPQIEAVCSTCLDRCGLAYGATVALETADFPSVDYDGAVFAAGEYDALKIALGDGAGHNWWCVLFPPLCFVDLAATADEDAVVAAIARYDGDNDEADENGYRISFRLGSSTQKRR